MDKGNELAALAEFLKITFGITWLCLIPMCFALCRQNPVSKMTLAFFANAKVISDFTTYDVSVDLHSMTLFC